MFLKEIQLFNYKNYQDKAISCTPGINCFVGLNGVGKTNILDAIYYMCMTKSRFSSTDRNVMRRGATYCRVVADFKIKTKKSSLVLKLVPGKRKEFELDKAVYEKLSDHIGEFPVVIIAPDDTDLVREGSEARRKFIDNTLSQTDKQYLEHLLQYNRVLKQRSALLKMDGQHMDVTDSLLASYDEQLKAPAEYIFEKRKAFVEQLQPVFYKYYALISGEKEAVQIHYKSKLQEMSWEEYIDSYKLQDIHSQRCNAGIHKDDLVFEMNGERVKQFSSQGQQKSFVLALKLSQYEQLRIAKERTPILLLDDIFDKLDNNRVNSLMQLLCDETFGQIFITDTDVNRIKKVVEGLDKPHLIFELVNEEESVKE